MPRSRPAHRLGDVISAATRVFAEKGYARAQMADVASAARLSAGALYGYAESKDALFHWCVEAAADPSVLTSTDLPLPTVPIAVTIERARTYLVGLLDLHGPLGRALGTRHTDDIGSELAAVIGELYDGTAKSWRLQAIIERSAQDIPELYDAFYRDMRQPVVEFLAAYLQMRIDDGYLRPLVDVPTTARLVLETQAWFARHRRDDPDSADIDDDVARATVIDVLSHGLIKHTRKASR